MFYNLNLFPVAQYLPAKLPHMTLNTFMPPLNCIPHCIMQMKSLQNALSLSAAILLTYVAYQVLIVSERILLDDEHFMELVTHTQTRSLMFISSSTVLQYNFEVLLECFYFMLHCSSIRHFGSKYCAFYYTTPV